MIPPLVQLGGCIFLASILAKWLPVITFSFPFLLIITIALIGVIFLVLSLSSFYKHQTSINPASPERVSSLVTTGIFRLTRNPMYVGMLLILISSVLWFGAATSILVVIIFFISIDRYQIRREEKVLIDRFGKSYKDYVNRVPRWLII